MKTFTLVHLLLWMGLQINAQAADVEVFLAHVIIAEGKTFTDTKFDGHFTKYGIIENTLTDWHRQTGQGDKDGNGTITWNDVRLLTWPDVVPIYKKWYWNRVKADQITAQRTADIIADFVVNSGYQSSFMARVQTIVGAKPDGQIGPATLRALNEADSCRVFREVTLIRQTYYRRICAKEPARLGGFLKGFFNRLLKLCTYENRRSRQPVRADCLCTM